MSMTEALSRTLALCRDSEVIGKNQPSDAQLVEAFRRTRVLLVADETNLSAAAGQHALVALFDLIARLGVSIELAIPDVPLSGFQAPVRGPRVQGGLLDLGRDLIPDCAAVLSDGRAPVDLAIVLGDARWQGVADFDIRLSGEAWSGASCAVSQAAPRWTGDFPIGGLVAVGIAAPEVFKFVLRRLGRELPHPVSDVFLAPVARAKVRVAPPEMPTGPFDLGQVDAVSGGAIVHAALFTLLHLPAVTASVRVIEPESLELSNLNRYALARRSDCGADKIAILHSWQRPGFDISGIPIRYESGTRDRILPLAPVVIVGTDDIPTRWVVQREWPSWLGVGATSHFLTLTSSHQPGQACAGCLHPRDDPDPRVIPTVSFVSYWAGLLLAVRLLRHATGRSPSVDEQQIACAPLRFDQPRAYWPGRIPRRADCPVRCTADRAS